MIGGVVPPPPGFGGAAEPPMGVIGTVGTNGLVDDVGFGPGALTTPGAYGVFGDRAPAAGWPPGVTGGISSAGFPGDAMLLWYGGVDTGLYADEKPPVVGLLVAST